MKKKKIEKSWSHHDYENIRVYLDLENYGWLKYEGINWRWITWMKILKNKKIFDNFKRQKIFNYIYKIQKLEILLAKYIMMISIVLASKWAIWEWISICLS